MRGPEDIDALVVARRILAAPKVARASHNEMLALAGCLVGLDQQLDALQAVPFIFIRASLAAAVTSVLMRHADWIAAEAALPDDVDEIGDHVDTTLEALGTALNALKTIFEQEFPHV